ncbi:MAG: hypothetical protein CBB68_13670 [Rhodospirillaceae bacterium TMED8]|nr:hypothetical protein [Magnetovibrio sp.]OUT48608.1 MAG: hypothetical protein CBB68_13670 [Rhodospirillaceae bacterium TMED8]
MNFSISQDVYYAAVTGQILVQSDNDFTNFTRQCGQFLNKHIHYDKLYHIECSSPDKITFSL